MAKLSDVELIYWPSIPKRILVPPPVTCRSKSTIPKTNYGEEPVLAMVIGWVTRYSYWTDESISGINPALIKIWIRPDLLSIQYLLASSQIVSEMADLMINTV